jgi:hypothetical protein
LPDESVVVVAVSPPLSEIVTPLRPLPLYVTCPVIEKVEVAVWKLSILPAVDPALLEALAWK